MTWANRAFAFLILTGMARLAEAGDEVLEAAVEAYLAEDSAAKAGEEGSPYRMRTETIFGSQQAVRKIAASGAYIDVDDLREMSLDDINRALRRVPGAYPREEEGFGLFPNISLRGVDTTRSAKITVMEDGVLTAPAPYSAPAAYYAPTAGRMHGVEVLKGTSQILYGPHTTGGVVNYISTPIPQKAAGYIKAVFGTNNEMRVHAWWGNTMDASSGRWGVLVEGYYRTTDGFKTIDTAPDFTESLAEDTGFTKTEPMVKVSWEPKTANYQRLEFKYGQTELDGNISYLGQSETDFRNTPYRRYSSSRFDNIMYEQHRTYLAYQFVPNDEFELEATAYFADFHRNWFKLHNISEVEDAANPGTLISQGLSNALAGGNGGNGLDVLKGERAGQLRLRNNNRDYQLWGVQAQGTWLIQSGEVQHEVTAGVRFHNDWVRRFQTDEFFDQAANGAIVDRTLGTPGAAGNRRQETDAVALYAQDKIESGKWTVTPGMRVELLDFDYKDFNNSADDGTDDLTMVSGGVSALYRRDEVWEYFGGVFRGVSNPGPRAAVRDGVTEETSLAFELGTRYARPVFSMSAVGFYTHFDDLIVIDNIGGAGTGDTENVGNADSFGLELLAEYALGKVQNWSFDNNWFAAFTYTHATLDGDSTSTDPESIFSGGLDGNRIPYIPEFMFTVGTTFTWPKFGFTVQGTYYDSTYSTASNTNQQLTPLGVPDSRFGTTDSFFIVDLSAYYMLKDDVRLLGGIQNVTDDAYLTSRHPQGPRPGKDLFAYIGLEVRF
jgi:Fe(3+) dicitrate transport protein